MPKEEITLFDVENSKILIESKSSSRNSSVASSKSNDSSRIISTAPTDLKYPKKKGIRVYAKGKPMPKNLQASSYNLSTL